VKVSRVFKSVWLWVFACVVVGALIAASQGTTNRDSSRAAHLESLVRCPSCEDLSVAQSNATAAIAVRNEIVAQVRAGRSDTEILTSLEATYGSAILLSPSTSGLGAILWLAPTLVGLLVLLSGARLWRRRR